VPDPVQISVASGTVVVYEAGDFASAAAFIREQDVEALKAEVLQSVGLGGCDLVGAVLELVAQRLERE
jgi:hypothetical protein